MSEEIDASLNIYRLLRISRGLEVKQLAEKLHVKSAYINMIESNKRIPSERLLISYANALNVDIEIIKKFEPANNKKNKYEHTLLSLLKLICDE